MLKLTYRTTLSYVHRIEDEPNLVDKSCERNHSHIDCPLIIKLYIAEVNNKEKFIDLNTIKTVTEKMLKSFDDINVTDKHLVGRSEDLIVQMRDVLLREFASAGMNINRHDLEIYLQETPKFGIELVSN